MWRLLLLVILEVVEGETRGRKGEVEKNEQKRERKQDKRNAELRSRTSLERVASRFPSHQEHVTFVPD